MIKMVENTLAKLAELILAGQFSDLETEGLEIKPVPADGTGWKERHKTLNAFLNTRGGIMVLGVKEEGTGPARRYIFTGWREHAEPHVKDFPRLFTDLKNVPQDLSTWFPATELRDFLNGRVAIVYIDELPADRKFVFYKGDAYKRILTGDHKISQPEIEAQEEFREEALRARELQPVTGLTESDLDLTKLNHFIFQLNQPVQVETMKADLAQARPFLERRSFIKEGAVTILGALVCAQHPGDCLGFRSHVHGYVDVPPGSDDSEGATQVVQDKQDFVDNVLQLMEFGLGYFLRNIQVGVSAREGGTRQPQYPVSLLRETVNNALAHRDYSIDRQVILSVKPGSHISIRNPGTFRRRLLIEDAGAPIPIYRILPEAKPRNPKLADVLRVYRKWEGRGIGMATMVNLCLENQLDLPYYQLFSEEVCLYLSAGRLVDEHMERLFHSFNAYLEKRLQGSPPTEEQKRVLSYLIKSELANEQVRYTILLTPDNNHFAALRALETARLITKHPASGVSYPVYVVDRVLMGRGHIPELRHMFGAGFDALDPLLKSVLGIVYRFNNYNKAGLVSAKQASYALWYEGGGSPGGIEQFDAFYRRVRYAFNKLLKADFVTKAAGTRGYQLNTSYASTHLL